jgi:hypothetical protein
VLQSIPGPLLPSSFTTSLCTFGPFGPGRPRRTGVGVAGLLLYQVLVARVALGISEICERLTLLLRTKVYFLEERCIS